LVHNTISEIQLYQQQRCNPISNTRNKSLTNKQPTTTTTTTTPPPPPPTPPLPDDYIKVEPLYTMMVELPNMDESALYALSLLREPRGCDGNALP
jgi:hypothetical protein